MSGGLRRAVWIVLDGVGVGALPDAGDYGDADAATLPHVAAECGGLALPNLQRLGLGQLAEIAGVPPATEPIGAFGRLLERAVGKDSTTGHWELAGVALDEPFATYPEGFPAELLDRFKAATGLEPLGNLAASGTEILKQYGAEHLRTGRPIVYTSVDSVFQIAVHETVMSPEQLYTLCRTARKLADEYRIGRVIARPFEGDETSGFRRTPRRKDFSLPPPQPTLLDQLVAAGRAVHAVGKISDLFAGRGVSESVATNGNADGMRKILAGLDLLPDGSLLAANLIDFDMLFGHRLDVSGFARALEEFDRWLPELQAGLRREDLLVITADHGCDPTTPGTDHTREYAPLLCWHPGMVAGTDLGVRNSFADVAATLAEHLGIDYRGGGESFWGECWG